MNETKIEQAGNIPNEKTIKAADAYAKEMMRDGENNPNDSIAVGENYEKSNLMDQAFYYYKKAKIDAYNWKSSAGISAWKIAMLLSGPVSEKETEKEILRRNEEYERIARMANEGITRIGKTEEEKAEQENSGY